MDFTFKDRVGDDGKDFNTMASAEYKLLYRQDAGSIFKEMIIDKELNHTEMILVREYFSQIMTNDFLGSAPRVHKTSYYHVAIELYKKIKLEDGYAAKLQDIAKRNKLTLNDTEALHVFITSKVRFALVTACLQLKNQIV